MENFFCGGEGYCVDEEQRIWWHFLIVKSVSCEVRWVGVRGVMGLEERGTEE